MSDLYINLTPKPDIDIPGRSCACCGKPLSTRGQVFLAPIDACVCKACGHDLLAALEPKATTIPVHSTPKTSSKRVVRKSSAEKPKGRTYEDILRHELIVLLAPYADKDGYIYVRL